MKITLINFNHNNESDSYISALIINSPIFIHLHNARVTDITVQIWKQNKIDYQLPISFMRLEQLTFTRFLAAVAIVIFHFGKDVFPFSHDSISFMFQQANMGVSYFFILSGFVMSIAYGNKDKINISDYIKKRLVRIYPVYALALLIYIAYSIQHTPVDFEELLLNVTLLQSWIPGEALSLNSPGWSLSVEIFFYASFPILFNHFYKKHSIGNLLIIALSFFILSQLIFHVLLYQSFERSYSSATHDFIFYFPLMHLNQFIIGNIVGLWYRKSTIKKGNYDLIIIGLVLLLAILFKYGFGVYYHNGMLAFIYVPIILFLSLNTGIITKVFNHKLLVYLGEISYGIYILQIPIFRWTGELLDIINIHHKLLVFIISLSVLIITSGLSYKYIERPLRQQIQKRKEARRVHINT